MANKTLFRSTPGKLVPRADTTNEAGGSAYAFSDPHALAQYAVTGCLNGTFYASATDQLATLLKLANKVDAEFVAKLAVYCREHGYMKDTPALLCAILATRDSKLFERVFDRVIDNGKMLRNFVQIIRSGVTGRKSFGSQPKRLLRRWLAARTDEQIFRAAIGKSPSLADIVRMVHPKPTNETRAALYGYMIGREYDSEALPAIVKAYESFKAGNRATIPDVPFQLLTALDLSIDVWRDIASRAPWQTTRMNLNTFARHGVFNDPDMAKLIASRLRDREAIRKARVFPYQLMSAFFAAGNGVPRSVTVALQDAMEVAIENVPQFAGKVYVLPDVSGSMQSPVTGYRRGSTSTVRCVDVAALVAAAVLRRNDEAEVMPFECNVVDARLNPRDSVMTNAKTLAACGGGGTNCSAPLRKLNKQRATGDLVIYVSDNESWIDSTWAHDRTATMNEWQTFKRRNPHAKMVCIDIQPYGSTQATEREDILNIGGFSDHVFEIIRAFADGTLRADHWLGRINAVEL